MDWRVEPPLASRPSVGEHIFPAIFVVVTLALSILLAANAAIGMKSAAPAGK